MYVLRDYIRTLLVEISKLPKEWFTEIDQAVTQSGFWNESNALDDMEVGPKRSLQTPAALKLETAIQDVFDDLGLDMDVFISSHDSDSDHEVLHPDHPAYPDKWLIDAKWYVSKQRPGRNTLDMEIMGFRDDANPDDVNSATLVNHITQSIRHELVHYTQMKKQSLKKGLYNDTEAFKEMVKDPSQIPNENDPKYWDVYELTGTYDEAGEEIIEKEGFNHVLHTQDYLRSHIEIDAHAHDAAEDLLAVYGYDEAKNMLRSGKFDLSDPKLPNAILHYYEFLEEEDPTTIRKLLKKMYSYVEYMKD
jgi:hypothetical protein